MRFALFITAVLLLGNASTPAQQADNARRFWPPEFRPPAQGQTDAPPPAKPRRYKTVRTARLPAQPASFGVTLWLLRATNDEGARGLVRVKKPGDPAAPAELMVAKRAPANTPLKIGQRLLLSVEVPQDGYLYVIDRERFADGSLGKPALVFPHDPQSAEHLVKAGRTVEVPGGQYSFEISRVSAETKQRLTGELLTFLITPEPLKDLPPAPADPAANYFLPPALVAGWEAAWQKNFQQLELAATAGQPRSLAEQEALTGPDKTLTRQDPLPQTVLQVAVKRGQPFLVRLPLRIAP